MHLQFALWTGSFLRAAGRNWQVHLWAACQNGQVHLRTFLPPYAVVVLGRRVSCRIVQRRRSRRQERTRNSHVTIPRCHRTYTARTPVTSRLSVTDKRTHSGGHTIHATGVVLESAIPTPPPSLHVHTILTATRSIAGATLYRTGRSANCR